MQIQEAVEVCVTQKYADFEGVATRPELWLFYLFVIAIAAVMDVAVPTLTAVFVLAMLVPWIAVGARRLHDTRRSGWWQLLGCVPVAGWIVLAFLYAQPGKSPVPPTAPASPTTPT